MTSLSAGARFRQALAQKNDQNQPLQIVGTINAYTAMMATQVGHQAIYLSGGGVANASFGLPDLGMTSLDNVLEDARRITDAVDTPLLVDIDTGFGGAFNIAQTIKKWKKRAWLLYISKTKWHKNAAAIAQTKKSSVSQRWSIA